MCIFLAIGKNKPEIKILDTCWLSDNNMQMHAINRMNEQNKKHDHCLDKTAPINHDLIASWPNLRHSKAHNH